MSESNHEAVDPITADKMTAEIAELLNPEREEAEPEQEAPAEPAETDEAQETEQAETEEPEKPAIDYDAEVPMPEGYESKTLGELKDFYQQNQEWQRERDNRETALLERENQLMAGMHELQAMAVQLGQVKPELLEQAQQMRQMDLEKERNLMDAAIPDWSNPETKQKDRAAMLADFKEYGFNEMDFGLIQDHRVVKMLRDFSRLKAMARRGEEALKQPEKPPKAQKPRREHVSESANQRKAIERAKSGTDSDKTAVISSLLEGL